MSAFEVMILGLCLMNIVINIYILSCGLSEKPEAVVEKVDLEDYEITAHFHKREDSE